MLEKNLDKVDWYMLSENPNAIHIFEKNMDKVDWNWLSQSPNAIHLLEKNLNKVNWEFLSRNPNAIHLLETIVTLLYYIKQFFYTIPNILSYICG